MNTEAENYILKHSEKENLVLNELFRDTNLNNIHPRMAAGHIQGRLLSFISRLKQPQNILEIGTYTGYSAICLAEGLAKNGIITSIETDDELEDTIRYYFKKAGIQENSELIIGDAKKIIPDLNKKFDMIYIDGNKREYPEYFKISKEKLNSKGILIADNVLWDSKITEPPDENDLMTKGILEYNRLVKEDKNFTNFIIPVRDGISIAEKIN